MPRSLPRAPAAAAVLALLWLLAFAWARPLMLPDEGRYVGVAWEMLRGGDWLTPTLDGLPYFHKPPLFYWITAASMAWFGPNEWAARAAPLLGAWAGALALALFARRWWGERAARVALLVLLAQPLFYVGGQFANLDMLVAGCITTTILLFAHAALAVEHGLPHRGAAVGAFAAAALGVLAKGLIGAVIPALVVGAWLLARRRPRVIVRLLWWPGPVVFVLLVAPWFVAMQQRFPGFAHYFFVVQHFKRFATGGFNNVQPFWFYPAVLLVASLPWLPWLASLVRRRDTADPARGPIRLLLLCWLATVVLFFSLPSSKLIGYILPALPPLALLVADGVLTSATASARATRLLRLGTGAAALLGVGIVAALAIHPIHSSREIALALRTLRGAHDPVTMLGTYAFDVPFYARLREPVGVVDDWSDPDVARRDNWRKELADAGAFAPARAARLLITPAALPASLCRAGVHWVLGTAAQAQRHAFLDDGLIAARHGELTLWRLDSSVPALAQALHCTAESRDGAVDG